VAGGGSALLLKRSPITVLCPQKSIQRRAERKGADRCLAGSCRALKGGCLLKRPSIRRWVRSAAEGPARSPRSSCGLPGALHAPPTHQTAAPKLTKHRQSPAVGLWCSSAPPAAGAAAEAHCRICSTLPAHLPQPAARAQRRKGRAEAAGPGAAGGERLDGRGPAAVPRCAPQAAGGRLGRGRRCQPQAAVMPGLLCSPTMHLYAAACRNRHLLARPPGRRVCGARGRRRRAARADRGSRQTGGPPKGARQPEGRAAQAVRRGRDSPLLAEGQWHASSGPGMAARSCLHFGSSHLQPLSPGRPCLQHPGCAGELRPEPSLRQAPACSILRACRTSSSSRAGARSDPPWRRWRT